MAKLKRFEIEGSGDAFTLHIEDEGGTLIEIAASRDQLDMIADALDDILLHDGTGDPVED